MRRTRPQQTWPGLDIDEGDIMGIDEAEEGLPIEFGRQSRHGPKGPL